MSGSGSGSGLGGDDKKGKRILSPEELKEEEMKIWAQEKECIQALKELIENYKKGTVQQREREENFMDICDSIDEERVKILLERQLRDEATTYWIKAFWDNARIRNIIRNWNVDVPNNDEEVEEEENAPEENAPEENDEENDE